MSEYDNNNNMNYENGSEFKNEKETSSAFGQEEFMSGSEGSGTHDQGTFSGFEKPSGESGPEDYTSFAAQQNEPEHVQADKVYEPENGSGYSSFGQQHTGSFADNIRRYVTDPDDQPRPEQKPETAKKHRGFAIICVILAAVMLVTGGFLGAYFSNSSNKTTSSKSSSSSSDKGSSGVDGGSVVLNAKADADALTTTEIAAIAKKSSVGVLVYSTKTNTISFGQSSSDSSGSSKTGEGTGVIIEMDKQGDYTYVITCAHVISDANISVKILLEDGTTYDADIVGVDEQTDVGLLRVKEKSLQKYAATIGTSKNLQVGQSVFAIGNPGGSDFFGSFTSGVVSAIGRTLSSSTGYTMECIQHDAAINPGNSGGGLFNAQGQLIGINSSKIASTEYEGMSFAIPIDEAVSIVNSLSSFGYVPNRPKLGINYSLARTYNQAYQMIVSFKGLPSGTLLIAKISSESSLNDLGVKAGDMIVSANGKKLDTADVLLDLIESGNVGDTIELGICRIENNNNSYNVKEFTVKATLIEDKGSLSDEEEEQSQSYEDYFNRFFGSGN